MINNNIIQIINATKRYTKKKYGIIDANISIPQGKVTAFVGRNGAGKTTTINLILGFIFLTEGQIYIKNKKINNLNGNKDIGYLPEIVNLSELTSIQEIIINFALSRNMKLEECKKRFINLAEHFNLLENKDMIIKNLSKGMKQKVGIIQALIHDPSIIILDEPTSGLDPVAKHDLFAIIKDQKSAGKTFIISSHKLDELEDICDEIVFFNNSRILKQVSCNEIHNSQSMSEIIIKPVEDISVLNYIKNKLSNRIEIKNDRICLSNKYSSDIELLLKLLLEKNIKILSVSNKGKRLEEYYLDLLSNEEMI